MIAADTNLLVHAHQREASLHPSAKEVIRRLAESPVPWVICLPCLVEFGGVAELWTVDRDFSRFPALKTRNPLAF